MKYLYGTVTKQISVNFNAITIPRGHPLPADEQFVRNDGFLMENNDSSLS